MVTKEQLERGFPSYRVHFAGFKHYDFFMLIRNDISFHVTISKEEKIAEVEIFKESKYQEIDKMDQLVVIDYINAKRKEYEHEYEG